MTVHDKKAVKLTDLATQFYLTEEDVGKNRAEACKEKLQELNTSVAVSSSSADLNEAFLKGFKVGCQGVPAGGVLVHAALHGTLCCCW